MLHTQERERTARARHQTDSCNISGGCEGDTCGERHRWAPLRVNFRVHGRKQKILVWCSAAGNFVGLGGREGVGEGKGSTRAFGTEGKPPKEGGKFGELDCSEWLRGAH